MLMLLFQIGADRYALETGQVAEVLPLVHLQRVPHAPVGVAGLFDFHGELVPVVDLSELLRGQKASARISTRIVLVSGKIETGERAFGLIAERTTKTLRCQSGDFREAGLRRDRVPLLARAMTDAEGVIYWLDVSALRTGLLGGLLEQAASQVA